jgi:methylmalonyl-CoA mutase
MEKIEIYRPKHKVRIVTASSLFDGHDASINIMRRLIQASGAEVIHLGHNRSVDEVVSAAIQEDVQAIAISSYQGGHVEYFKYMVDLLKEKGSSHIRLFGGGGGVIIPSEIKDLENYGITKIYSPEDGRKMGLQGMINHMMETSDFAVGNDYRAAEAEQVADSDKKYLARCISYLENGTDHASYGDLIQRLDRLIQGKNVPVIGLTGTGGAGKSSLTDELVRRFVYDFPNLRMAVLSIDPSKQKSGGALLGDRIRMNSVHHPNVYMRSLATRESKREISDAIEPIIKATKAAGYDLILVETSGIGQGNSAIVDICDFSVYVMTSEYGAPSQLEKIDMLDFADMVVINKFDRKGSDDALRDVRKQYRRNHNQFVEPDESLPVYGTIASQFNDRGTNLFYKQWIERISERFGHAWRSKVQVQEQEKRSPIIPADRIQYLYEIVQSVRQYKKHVEDQALLASKLYQLNGTKEILSQAQAEESIQTLDTLIASINDQLHKEVQKSLEEWPKLQEDYRRDEYVVKIRDKEIRTPLFTTSLSGTKIPKVALPRFSDWGDTVRWIMLENVPGSFPYTAGVFPFKRQDEDPKRQFAGEGTPERTNRRFHYLSRNDSAKRLSTAFDSVTLYGEDPDWRPDIYGKVGESGVSVCTLEDMKKLYAGFDLCHPNTSVSMTINGPAPIILAMFMNTAITQQVEKFATEQGRQPNEQELAEIKAYTLRTVRGTVQADILKEDQGQNTCIFSTEFALKMMGDVQQYFIDQQVRNYYSVSISGYHIAEAGANPISQLAFTLANGFTYVEYYLSRGMNIDDFAANLSFFFSNGLDPEYTVIGRVARRIWAIVMKNKYSANERSQKLKYHIQTSGRSLHAQEIDFNDIRTTLQALMAIYDNCNSLHTNAYDEAITTPTEESVRRAMAIQLIITKELGLAKNENSLQGSFIMEELTQLVEEAVLYEFERLNDRGGVLGAMERQYQRSKIQEESMYYEHKKHSGELPIIGVNTFFNENATGEEEPVEIELARATQQEKEMQIANLTQFKEANEAQTLEALQRLRATALANGNIFVELMETVKVASLGQISQTLYEVGGKYRRNM